MTAKITEQERNQAFWRMFNEYLRETNHWHNINLWQTAKLSEYTSSESRQEYIRQSVEHSRAERRRMLQNFEIFHHCDDDALAVLSELFWNEETKSFPFRSWEHEGLFQVARCDMSGERHEAPTRALTVLRQVLIEEATPPGVEVAP